MNNSTKWRSRSAQAERRRGMILLVVLGMLGLFSLLAVTYLVFSSNSQRASVMLNRAKLQTAGDPELPPLVLTGLLYGSKNFDSAFAGHSLLGDVYGRDAIEGSLRDYRIQGGFAGASQWGQTNTVAANPPHGAILMYAGGGVTNTSSSQPINSEATLLKLSLAHQDGETNDSLVRYTVSSDPIQGGRDTLSIRNDAYNGRVFTMLEGPLANISFRILDYIGYEPYAENILRNNTIDDPLAFSVVVDTSDIPTGLQLSGQVGTAAQNSTYTGTFADFVRGQGGTSYLNALFYDVDGRPYRYLMNDAVYNGLGYGTNHLTGDLSQNWFQQKDSTRQPWDPSVSQNFLATVQVRDRQVTVPVGLLPSMEYISPNILQGSANEGFDVPDYRDFFLSSFNPSGEPPNGSGQYDASRIIPSYHRPELINYIRQLYVEPKTIGGTGGLQNRSAAELVQMLRFIAHATARPLPVLVNGDSISPYKLPNSYFTAGILAPQELTIDDPPTPAQVSAINTFIDQLVYPTDVSNQPSGWDVDTDGDGYKESVWVDAGLPTITTPEGKMLKPMAAVQIVDLDGRINLNLAGDVNHGYVWDGLDNTTITSGPNQYTEPVGSMFARTGLLEQSDPAMKPVTDFSGNTVAPYAVEGLGAGPMDLSLAHLWQRANGQPYDGRFAEQTRFVRDILSARYGRDVPTSNPPYIHSYAATQLPGIGITDPSNPTSFWNDFLSRLLQRSRLDDYTLAGAFGRMPQLNRGRAVVSLDRGGNYSFQRPPLRGTDGQTFANAGINTYTETFNDGFESSQDPAQGDSPFTMAELERVLRRFDADVANLPDRLHKILAGTSQGDPSPRYNNMTIINRIITTRSHELRHAPIGYAGRDTLGRFDNFARDTNTGVGTYLEQSDSLLHWISLLHEQRYRVTNSNNESTTNDPSAVQRRSHDNSVSVIAALHPALLRALMPVEFRHGLRMDINRPLGNHERLMDLSGTVVTGDSTVDDVAELAYRADNNTGNMFSYGFNELEVVGLDANGNPVYAHGHYDGVDYSEAYDAIANFPYPALDRPATFQGNTVNPTPNLTRPNATPGTYALPDPSTDPLAYQKVAGSYTRQAYARQLYCLAQLLVPQEYVLPTMTGLTWNSTTNVPSDPKEWYDRRARVLAQWAVNVVDFRDPDAKCTRFEYDQLPFGIRTITSDFPAGKAPGWAPQAGSVVWGMEYPELVMTETLAFHDTRVRVTRNNPYREDQNGQQQKVALPMQYRIPEGSLFVELHVPRTLDTLDGKQAAPLPNELYTQVGGSNKPGLNLAKVAPGGAYGQQPVWRIGVAPAPPFSQRGDQNDFTKVETRLNDDLAGGNLPENLRPADAGTATAITNQTTDRSPPPTHHGGDPTKDRATWELNGLLSVLGNPTAELEFERVIEFTHSGLTVNRRVIPNLQASSNDPTVIGQRVFRHRLKTPLDTTAAAITPTRTDSSDALTVEPGGYLVLAPRYETRVGSRYESSPSGMDDNNPTYKPSHQRLLATSSPLASANSRPRSRLDVFGLYDDNTERTADADVQNILFQRNARLDTRVAIIQSDPPTGWAGGTTEPLYADEGIGLNVSAPTADNYYPKPNHRLNSNDTATDGYANRRPDAYVDFKDNPGNTEIPLGREPFDHRNDENPILTASETDSYASQYGTHLDFRTLYLQRLADPDSAYHPTWNPYITIDVMPVDLTLYTGENNEQKYVGPIPQGLQPQDYPTEVVSTFQETDVAFESRFKDGRDMSASRTPNDNATLPVMPPAANNGNTPRLGPTNAQASGSYFSVSTAQLYKSERVPYASPTAPQVAYFPYVLGLHRPEDAGDYPFSSASLGYVNAGHQLKEHGATTIDGTYTTTPDPNWAFNHGHPTTGSFDGIGPPLLARTYSPPTEIANTFNVPASFQGMPDPAFRVMGGLYWPNRDFVNVNELMMVPFTAPGRFGMNYTGRDIVASDPLYQSDPGGSPNGAGYLWNFFDGSDLQGWEILDEDRWPSSPTQKYLEMWQLSDRAAMAVPPDREPYNNTDPLPTPRREAYWQRATDGSNHRRPDWSLMLELLEVPPAYAESYSPLHPFVVDVNAQDTTFNQNANSSGNTEIDKMRRRYLADFRAPYHLRPTYTSPGKINLNTIDDGMTWQAMEWAVADDPLGRASPYDLLNAGSSYFRQVFTTLRRGYPATSNANPNIDNRFPSQFVGAFGNPFAANVTVPLPVTNERKFRSDRATTRTLLRQQDVAQPITPASVTARTDSPAVGPPTVAPADYASASPMLPSTNQFQEQAASPHHALDRLKRMANLTTTQSNVFAVWITVGYFEWDPLNGLGREYVRSEGSPHRQRSFFIIDRSIPVAWREGEAYNSKQTILLQRNLAK